MTTKVNAKPAKTAPAEAKTKQAAPKTAPANLALVPPAKVATAKESAAPDAAEKITLLAKENPHGEKTKDFAKWKLVTANLTVDAALKAGVDRGYLNYMATKRKLIAIG